MKRGWDDLVAEGRRIVHEVDHRQWKLGDLAIEVVGLAAGIHDNAGRGGRLAEFAEAIGCDYDVLRKYRSVSSAWKPADRHTSASWALHRLIYTDPARREIMNGYLAEARAQGQRAGESGLQRFLSRRRGERIAVVRRDAHPAPSDGEPGGQFYKVLDSDQRAQLREHKGVRPGPAGRTPEDAVVALNAAMTSARRSLTRIAEVLATSDVMDAEPGALAMREDMGRWLAEVVNTITVIKDLVVSGERLDDAVQRILREGG